MAQITPPLPPGFTPVSANAATPPPLPPGFSPVQSQDADAAHAERAARSREGVDQSAKPQSFLGDVATEAGHQAAETVGGAATLVNEGINKVLPSGAQLPTPQIDPNTRKGIGTDVGGALENIAEFAGGEEALKGLKAFVQTPTAVLDLMQKYPIPAKIITAMAKAGTVGAAQGGLKGAPEGKATEGAVEGGAGAAGTTGAFEGALESMGPLAKVLGIGGRTPEEALTKAGRPYVGEHNWQASATKALPDLAKMDPSTIHKVGDFTDALHDSANEIRVKEFQPMIDRHATDVLSPKSVATNIAKAATPWMDKYEPEQSEEIRDFAKKFNGDMTLEQAETDLKGFNKALSKYYKAGPRDAAGMLQMDGTIAKYEAAADGLRDLIYGHLKSVGEKAPEDVQARYGALKDLERVISKRATVADNQAALSLPQTLAGLESIGALATGHPMAAAGGVAAIAGERARQTMAGPAGLIRQAIRGAGGESAGPEYAAGRAIASTAKALRPAAETAVGSLGEQAHDLIQVTGPDGKTYQVSPEHLQDTEAKP